MMYSQSRAAFAEQQQRWQMKSGITLRSRSATATLLIIATVLLSSCQIDKLLSSGKLSNEEEPGDVEPVATRLLFDVQPVNTQVGEAITPALQVSARDESGATVTAFTGEITVSIASNPSSGTLAGTTTRAAVAGVATFTGISIDNAGNGYRITASSPGLTGATTTPFSITSAPPPPPNVLTLLSGSGQTANTGATLANPYVVQLRTSSGQAVSGATVTWTVISGGGSIAATSTTNSSGQASATHTLGPATGTQSVTATVAGATGSPVTFTATATAPPNTLSIASGNSQSATAGTALPNPYVVVVRNAAGQGVSGVTVNWSVTSGGGSIPATSTTNSSGQASATHTLGSATGSQSVTATVTGAIGSPVTFTSTATAPPVQPNTLSIVSGNSQSATAGTALPNPYVVIVRNAAGQGVSGVTVNWTVTSGGGSIPAISTTNSSGQASATHTLGSATGSQSVTATVTGATGSPVTFTSTATAPPVQPNTLSIVSGNSQSATVGTALPNPYVVIVRNAAGQGVSGVTVNWSVISGGGAIPPTSLTNSSGQASVTHTLGSTVGTQQVTATVTGATGSPVTFSSTGTAVPAPVATRIALVSGNTQSDTIGATLAPYVVRVTDASNNPVAGTTVTWAITAGTGSSITVASATTNSLGTASATLKLGTSLGAHTVTASAAGLQGSPVTFTSTATHGAPSRLEFTQQPTTAERNKDIKPNVRVSVLDRLGNVATSASVTITMSIVPLTGTPLATLSGDTSDPTASGVATFENLRINLVGNGYRLRAAGAGMTVDSAPFNITN